MVQPPWCLPAGMTGRKSSQHAALWAGRTRGREGKGKGRPVDVGVLEEGDGRMVMWGCDRDGDGETWQLVNGNGGNGLVGWWLCCLGEGNDSDGKSIVEKWCRGVSDEG